MVLFLKQALILPFLCHKKNQQPLVRLTQTKLQTLSRSLTTDLCNCVKTKKEIIESTAPPQ